jgi:CRP/FNR family transcriptional regulator, dissimilatory nitrate respiration regulator
MDYSILSGSPLFSGINPDNIELILKMVPYRTRKYQTGLTIVQSGEHVNSLIIVLKGAVKGVMADFAGRVIKIEEIPAPGALAAAFIFGNMNKYPVTVIAVTDSELLYIDKSDFLKVLMKNDSLLINFLNMISNRSQFLSEKIKFLNFKTIKGKLANLILQKVGKDGSSSNLGMTQNDLADFFGVTRPSIARAISELEKDKFIEAKGRYIRIIDKEALGDLIIE